MLAMTDKGNLETVREALSGITGVKLSPDRDEGADWFMVVVRSNYHLDAVDGLRRQGGVPETRHREPLPVFFELNDLDRARPDVDADEIFPFGHAFLLARIESVASALPRGQKKALPMPGQ